MRFGLHTSIQGSFAESVRRAAELSCTCMQIFAGPPRNYSRAVPDDEQAAEFRALVREHDIKPVVVHAGYLLHLISAKPKTAHASRTLYHKELEVAAALGADYFVLHPGSAAGRPHEELIADLAEAMKSAEDVQGPMILMENSANTNTGIGARFEEIGALLERLDDPKRFAMCFDTAHATGAGYDLSTPEAAKKTLSQLYRHVGKRTVKVVHANDSKADIGSNRDLHHHIGQGAVGEAGFRALFSDTTMKRLPFILETPIDQPGDDAKNLAALRALAEGED